MKKIFISLLILIMTTSLFAISYAEVPTVNQENRIYDFADLLDEFEEISLFAQLKNYIQETHIDMIIVTTDNNTAGTAMEYADDFVDKNEFGLGNKNSSILFLIDMDTRELYISTAGSAIEYYDDDRIDRILDDCYDEISNQKYFECCRAFISGSLQYYKEGIPESNKEYQVVTNTNTGRQEFVQVKEQKDIWEFLDPTKEHHYGLISIVALLLGFLLPQRVKSSQKTVATATSANNYVCNQNWVTKDDTFLSTRTTTRYIPPPDTSSGGSYRSSGSHGGSSTHYSSGGHLHGGGGRHF